MFGFLHKGLGSCSSAGCARLCSSKLTARLKSHVDFAARVPPRCPSAISAAESPEARFRRSSVIATPEGSKYPL